MHPFQILKPLLGDIFHRRAVLPFSSFVDKVFSSSLACGLGYLAVAAAITAFVVVDSLDQGSVQRSPLRLNLHFSVSICATVEH